MSCDDFRTSIDGHEYYYTQLTAKKSLKLKFRLAALIGSAMADIMPAIGKSDEIQLKAFGSAIQDVFGRNNPDLVLKLMEDILIPCFIDEERIDIDKHFTGKTMELYHVMFWVLKCEYGNFIQGINIGEEKKKVPVKSTETSES